VSSALASGASEAVARFAVAAHGGAAFDAALHAARARLDAARNVLAASTPASNLAERALAPDGPTLRRAFVEAAVLAAAPATRVHAAVVAVALAAVDESATVEAIAVGCEVVARLQRALELDPAWDAAAVSARLGAAAAAARALGLDAAAGRHALGLAATQAAGLGVAEGSPAGEYAHAKAAADAVEGAVLARHGFTSPAASLEGRRGLAALMAANFDELAVCDELGRRWISAAS
jgi:2-methylcitrate dehydratase MmgE/PrpD-like protein